MATTPTTPPNIADLSTPPTKLGTGDTVFVAAVDTFFSELPNFGDQQNDLADWEKTTATQVYNNALEAEQSAIDSEASALLSEQYKDAAAISANAKGDWSSATGAGEAGSVYYHTGTFWQLLIDVVDITLTEPSNTNSQWAYAFATNVDRCKINNPLLWLFAPNSIAKSFYGVSGITSTRNDEQSYIDMYGTIKQSGIDEISFNNDWAQNFQGTTNFCLYNEDFTNGSWNKARSTLSLVSDNISSDDVTRFTEDLTTGQRGFSKLNVVADDTAIHTFSVLVKPDDNRKGVRLTIGDNGRTLATNFNLVNGTYTEIKTDIQTGYSSIEYIIDGWWLLSVSVIPNVPTTGVLDITLNFSDNPALGGASYTGDGSSGVLVKSVQLEQCGVSTPHIKTVASTETRASDFFTVEAYGNIPRLDNEFTYSVDVLLHKDDANTGRLLSIDSLTGGVFEGLRISPGGKLAYINDGLVLASSSSIRDTASHSCVVTSDGNNVYLYVDGNLEDSDTLTSSLSLDLTTVTGVGNRYDGGSSINGKIKNLRVWDKFMNAQEIREL